jgi:hypothetical protein
MYPFFFLLFFFSSLFGENFLETPTYFTYSKDQLTELKRLDSPLAMGKDQLKRWDQTVQKYYLTRPDYFQETRLFTYLCMAQAEVAKLSFQVYGELKGSLDTISENVIELFIPDMELKLKKTDDLSQKLAEMVLPKIIARKKKEEARSHFTVAETQKEYYIVGLDIASWIPWVANPQEKYWPKQPPKIDDPQWKKEIEEIKQAQKPMTEKKRKAIYYWAGLSGPLDGDWRVIANDYLFSHDVSLSKIIQVRQALMVGLYDGCISSFNAKYSYLVDRPSKRYPLLETEIDVPGHPSYPSNHSYTSEVSAYILTYFFPQDKQHWADLSEEAGMSRIWAGIHYPIDHIEGREAGKRLGEKVIEELD